jgi:hypothetical protein
MRHGSATLGRLFGGDISSSIDSAKAIAMSHEGDRQYWHAMVASHTKPNYEVKNAIMVYCKNMYEASREATESKRWWYYGRILHLIEDSYSDAHVARNIDDPLLPIRFFQNYAVQDGHKHGISDTKPEEDEESIKAGAKKPNADIKLMQKIAARKKKLYAQAMLMSERFLEIVFVGGSRDSIEGPKKSKDLWPRIKDVLDAVFTFDLPTWSGAVAGSSLPEYAKEGVNGRKLDSHDYAPGPGSQLVDQPQESLSFSLTQVIGVDLVKADAIGDSDPFIVITGDGVRGTPFQTTEALPMSHRMSNSKSEVVWDLDHDFVGDKTSELTLTVYDSDTLIGVPSVADSDLLGIATIKLHDFFSQYYFAQGKFDASLVGTRDGAIEVEARLFDKGGTRVQGRLRVRGAARWLSGLYASAWSSMNAARRLPTSLIKHMKRFDRVSAGPYKPVLDPVGPGGTPVKVPQVRIPHAVSEQLSELHPTTRTTTATSAEKSKE